MLEIVSRRWPCAEVWVCGVRVQGPDAPQQIAGTVRYLNRVGGIDVILLGRGGGSSEDLAAFNHEGVANAIFNSTIPVVSAVGHEIDVTIADLVADRRAATPSEAAELATPNRVELIDSLLARARRLHQLLVGRHQNHHHRLRSLGERRIFRFPLERLREQERRVDDRVDRLQKAMRAQLQRARQRIDAIAGKLESLSPLNVLARGYSLTRTIPDGHVIRSISDAKVDDAVEIVLGDGRLQAEVRKVAP
jgi:exodeoxyribonuclease VII large subunit